MSNLGFQGVYHLLNKRDDTVCERAFLPDEKDIEEHIRTKTPLFSLESKLPIERFNIIAFSLSFENDYPNILKILRMSNIPFSPHMRTKYHPLLIAGGACMFFNPEPVAPFFDIIFIGEAEESLNEFIDLINSSEKTSLHDRHTSENDPKEEIKKIALNIKGVYVPDYYEIIYNHSGLISKRIPLNGAPANIQRRFISDLNSSKISHAIISSETEFSDMSLVEIMRGCQWNCRFCMVGHVYNPPRKKSLDIAIKEIENLKKKSKRVGLIGPSLGDYPSIEDILAIKGVDFSITSLRASPKSLSLIKVMKEHRSISIAPEAGTERLRRVINKKITEQDILQTAEEIFNSGIESLRLYFMIGLPTEDIDDISAIIRLVKMVRSLSNKGNIILSISTFVPKPFTPFQWHPMDTQEFSKNKLQFIKKSLSNIKSVRVFHDLPKYALMQGLFALGDRRVMKVLKAMVETENWQKAASLTDLNIDYYLFREKKPDENLPWDFIDNIKSKKDLWDEYLIALNKKS